MSMESTKSYGVKNQKEVCNRRITVKHLVLSYTNEIVIGSLVGIAPVDSINPLNTKSRLLYLKTQFVPRSKHFSSRL
jgi:hypothetical protein